jgi:hypothetical protein
VQNREDTFVVVGHPQTQLCDQMGTDVNAGLNRELDCMLRGESAGSRRIERLKVGRFGSGIAALM